ncbi:hypothetical protein [Fimbriiglobus ruber]|uniref:hypothetical protein n=1 Tax=Fimbriiglobus ruber TaxID=1908690 RepID=UPI00117AD914|nr:hypothetical protein [Fimbriiglobus ruber]
MASSEESAQQTWTRCRGTAAALLTEPKFLSDQEGLRNAYLKFPIALRPTFPFRPAAESFSIPVGSQLNTPADSRGRTPTVGMCDRPPVVSDPVMCPTVAFRRLVQTLLSTWNLSELTYWGLPCPETPLVPNLLPAGSHLQPRSGVVLNIPLNHPVGADVVDQICAAQRREAEDRNIPPDLVGGHHVELYARMFHVIRLEVAARSRFPTSPRNLVAAIEEIAATELDVSKEYVGKLRKWIRRCQGGKRHAVRQLRIKK